MKKSRQRPAPRRKPVLKGRGARVRERGRLVHERNLVIEEQYRREEEVRLASVAAAPSMVEFEWDGWAG